MYLLISNANATYLCSIASKLSFIGQVEELLFGAVNVVLGSSDGDFIALAVCTGEFYGNTTTVFHNGVDKLPFSADKGIVELGRNRDLFTDDVLEFVLDLANLLSGFLYVFSLPGDGDDVVLVTLGRKIDFRVRFLADFTYIGTA